MPRVVSRVARRRVVAGRRRIAVARVRNLGLVKRSLARGVHSFKRTVFYSGAISGSTIADNFGVFQFSLAAVTNYTEFTNLFDMYKINKVKLTFMPRGNSADVGSAAAPQVKFFSVIDYDDITPPTSLGELLQYDSLKTTRCTNDHSRTLAPCMARQLYNNGITSAYGPARGWIDCDNPSVQHFGLKWCWQMLPSGNQYMDVKVDYYMSFKGVR